MVLADRLKNLLESIRRRLEKVKIFRFLKVRWFSIIFMVVLLLLSSGLFNYILEGSKPQYAASLILRTRSLQNALETFTNIIIMILGLAGVYLIYQGSRGIRISNLYLFAGFFMLFLALIIIMVIFNLKV
ncbi:MAG: hypothetical protein QXX95_06050 [Nitrososphaerales archaeon]